MSGSVTKEQNGITKSFRVMAFCTYCGYRSPAAGFINEFDPYRRAFLHFKCGNCEAVWEISEVR